MRVLKILLVLSISLILVIALSVFWFYRSLNEPIYHDKADQFIQIPKGAGTQKILDILVSEGILQNRYPLMIYLKLFADESKLKSGEYQFPSPITALQILEKLQKGQERVIKITIPEGWTRFDIARRLAEKLPSDPPTSEREILELMSDTSLIRDFDPLAKNLEGYLYPDTYIFPVNSKPADVIKRMVEQFRKVWKPEWTERARQMGMQPRDIVIIASLIETETKMPQEKPLVASVIYNRLKRGIPLGIDQTVVYIAKIENRWDGTIHVSDINSDSPYNTRKFAGLPPGPIASPSASSIEAALNPAQTDYLYYVLDAEKKDGSHKFHVSAKDFEIDKRAYQQWLEEQRKSK